MKLHLILIIATSLSGAAASASEADVRPVAILFHGCHASASQVDWQPLASRLEAAGYRVLTPELPGHGAMGGKKIEASGDNSAWMAAWRREGQVVVEATLAKLETAPTVVIGAGCGGFFALLLAERWPVEALVSISGLADEQQLRLLTQARIPTLGIAAAEDRDVPQRVRTIVAAVPGSSSRFELVAGKAHGTALLIEQPSLVPLIVEWLRNVPSQRHAGRDAGFPRVHAAAQGFQNFWCLERRAATAAQI